MGTSKKHFEHYISIFAGCLQYMAGDAYGWGNTETGGGLYGLWSHAGRPVVMVATPAGPGACNDSTHFAQDADHLMAVSRNLQEKFAIQYIGNWHSHHRLALDQPSRGDMEQIHRVASRNNIPRLIQIVLTYAEETPLQQRRARFGDTGRILPYGARSTGAWIGVEGQTKERVNMDCPKIRVNAYIYNEASKGSYLRCSINLLSGPSPIRMALADSDILWPPGRPTFEDFPLKRIVCDGLEFPTESRNTEQSVTDALVRQLDELPDHVSKQAEMYPDESMILLLLPLTNGIRIGVRYVTGEYPPKATSVWIVHPNKKHPFNVTNGVLAKDRNAPLRDIYKRLAKNFGTNKKDGFLYKCCHSVSRLHKFKRP